jgi:hypothetical protein
VPGQADPSGGYPTATGASCGVLTSVDSLSPGAVAGGKRAIWEIKQLSVLDGGADGDADSSPNTVYARQGVFVRDGFIRLESRG